MFNKVIMIGHLTRDVELKHLNTGTAVARIGLASNSVFKKQDGSRGEDTCFVDVNLFGRTAEIANEYLRKGSKILIEGRLRYEPWTDQQGNKRSKHTITAEKLEMLDTKAQSENRANQGYGDNYSSYGSSYASNYGSNNSYGNYGNQGGGFSGGNSYSQNSYSQNSSRQSGSSGSNTNKQNEMPEINLDDEVPF